METLYLILFFIFGTIMGSFYHVLATRLSNGLSIVKPPSHCENCKNSVERYLNEIDGVVAKVNLQKKRAVVSMNRIIADEELKKAIEEGQFREHQTFTKELIALRKAHAALRDTKILWHHDALNPRLVCYDRPADAETVRVYINSTGKDVPISADPIFTHRYENGILKANGILICKI